ncbi:Trp repressor-binding protein [Serratia plymuthica]|uniref:Trp repressor-binding protein n=1 Tax=Serratia plymuthica TaxID=82996 RepID=A0A2X4UQ00_SERPL|nr:Trp repressor-binding protein [Serratia plymuthica]
MRFKDKFSIHFYAYGAFSFNHRAGNATWQSFGPLLLNGTGISKPWQKAVAEGARRVSGVEVTVKRVPENHTGGRLRQSRRQKAIKKRLSPRHRSWPITMALSSVPLPALATWPGRCAPSSIKPGGCGLPARCMARSAAYFRPPVPAAARSTLSPPPGPTLAHHGFIIVPIGYATPELFDVSHTRGGTPYGATTIAGGDGSRQPSQEELTIARYQGEHVAKITAKLKS